MVNAGVRGASRSGDVGRPGRPTVRARPGVAPWLAAVAGLAAPLALAAAWIPVRRSLPNVDLALVLVAAVMAVGALGSSAGALVAAGSAALWFTYFDTRPFETLVIYRAQDVATMVVMAAVGAVAGVSSARAVQQRRLRRSGDEDLARLRASAERLATTEELGDVVGAIAADIASLLGLEGCEFDASPAAGQIATVARDGSVSRPPGAAATPVLLPVWAQGQLLGHFVMTPGPTAGCGDRLRLAQSLADQAGAALIAYLAPPEPPAPPPGAAGPLLRVVR
ncbi:MAG TPA: DUF4118 domain-containing protein [Acidimicrobiales bacterium]|nr:DUF4118 domain-containing protein [Acidimicrobiales bacterium]